MIFIKRPRSKYSLLCCALCFLNSFLPLVMLQHDFLNNSVYIIYTYSYNCRKLYILKSPCAYCVVAFVSNAWLLTHFTLKELWKVDFVLNCVHSECSVSDDC